MTPEEHERTARSHGEATVHHRPEPERPILPPRSEAAHDGVLETEDGEESENQEDSTAQDRDRSMGDGSVDDCVRSDPGSGSRETDESRSDDHGPGAVFPG